MQGNVLSCVLTMSPKLFHSIMRSPFTQPQFIDRTVKLLFIERRCHVFASRQLYRQICCSPGLHSYQEAKENIRLPSRLSSFSPNPFTSKLLVVPFSSTQHNPESHKRTGGTEDVPKKEDQPDTSIQEEEEKNLSIFQRFKKMYRDYWYVLVPVHVITSLGWFGGFYYLAKSGVDIATIVEAFHLGDHIPNALKDSSAGYLAVSYALYKIATPVRYMVTIGGTTVSIKYLKECGYIKPIPPKARLKEMYQERKENLKEKRHQFAEGFKQKRDQLKERRESLIRERRERTRK